MGLDQDFPASIEVQFLGGPAKGERTTANLCTPGTEVVMNDTIVKSHCVGSQLEDVPGRPVGDGRDRGRWRRRDPPHDRRRGGARVPQTAARRQGRPRARQLIAATGGDKAARGRARSRCSRRATPWSFGDVDIQVLDGAAPSAACRPRRACGRIVGSSGGRGMGRVTTGGGWRAVLYTLKKAREVGGLWPLWKAMRSKNACKTCALGMGGQAGGMVNEAGHFPEVCKKSFQAMVADMQGAVKPSFFETYSLPQLRAFTPHQLEHSGRLVQPVVLEKGSQHYRPIEWGEAMERIAAKLEAHAARGGVLLLQRPLEQRGGLPAAALRPALRHQPRQQLQLLLPSGQRRGAGQRDRHRRRHREARRHGARRLRVPDRRQSRRATTPG